MKSLSSSTGRPTSARPSTTTAPASAGNGNNGAGNSLMREDAKKMEQDIGASMMKMMPKSDKHETDDVEGVDAKDWVRQHLTMF